ncbi:MAG: pyruvate kinase [Verrucomicrobiae bacterium]|nr:pyruvate kinase [Verrucomicrobiae bacterium]
MRKTKIICTLGPASQSDEMLGRLMDAGMNIVRLNMSHAVHDWVRSVVPRVRRLSAEKGINVGILMDTQGPAIRTGDLPAKLDLKVGDIFTFTVLGAQCEEEYCVNVNYDGLVKDLRVGETVVLDNGVLRMEVLEKTENRIRCRVLTPGIMGSRRHINLPGVRVNLPAMTAKDLADIRLGCELDVDYVALSFCREARDIAELRNIVKSHGKNPRLVAKIEDQEAVRNLNAIINEADAVMVARGDLGIECALEDLPIIQRRIVKQASIHLKPVIVATHMLESMIENPYPTRAEITDVANAVYEQVDAIMLSGETTTGKYPVGCVEVLDRIARRTERSGGVNYLQDLELESSREKFLRAAVIMANEMRAAAIVLFTRTGYLASMTAALRPRWSPVYAFTDTAEVAYKLSLNRSIFPFVCEFLHDPERNVLYAEKFLLDRDLILPGSTLVVVTETQAERAIEDGREGTRTIELIQMRVVE